MSAALPSLEAQAERWRELNESQPARFIRMELEALVAFARANGLNIEIELVSFGHRMGCTTEQIHVTPSRAGYQSTN